MAAQLDIPLSDYDQFERAEVPIQEWALKLADFAIGLEVPTSRLVATTGKSADAGKEAGQCGKLIRANREKRELSIDALATKLGMPTSQVEAIEAGNSPIEQYAPLLLHFAEIIEQPIFNLFYPCGVPLDQLDDYP